jgi:hypothetical protein
MVHDGTHLVHSKDFKQMEDVVTKAKKYKLDLERLLNLDFEKPSQELREFASENNLDLADPNVKQHFTKIRDDYLKVINKFYEQNLSLENVLKPSKKLENKTKAKKIEKPKLEKENPKKTNTRTYKPQYLFFLALVAFLILIVYLAINI